MRKHLQLPADRDLDVITVGTVMAELSAPAHSLKVTEAESLVLVQAGSATTFALAFSRLGGRLGLISRVGDDELGRWIVETLVSEGVDTEEIRAVKEQLTPLSLASVDARGLKSFAYYRFAGFSEPITTLNSSDIPDSYLQRAKIFEITESSLRASGSRPVTMELVRRAKSLGCLISVNPNFRPTAWQGGASEAADVLRQALALADIAIMNGEEARLVSGAETIEQASNWLMQNGPSLNVITQGERSTIVVNDETIMEIPALPTNVVFDIGAGDTFHAGFLARFAAGDSVEHSVHFATRAASMKIQRPPQVAHLPSRAEVDAALNV